MDTLVLIWFIHKMSQHILPKQVWPRGFPPSRFLLVIYIFTTLFLTIFSATSSDTNTLIPQTRIIDSKEPRKNPKFARALASQNVDANFRPSLEMMEAVDYLLSPALIINDALDLSVIPTYPSE
jgi:hypothetical protein